MKSLNDLTDNTTLHHEAANKNPSESHRLSEGDNIAVPPRFIILYRITSKPL